MLPAGAAGEAALLSLEAERLTLGFFLLASQRSVAWSLGNGRQAGASVKSKGCWVRSGLTSLDETAVDVVVSA